MTKRGMRVSRPTNTSGLTRLVKRAVSMYASHIPVELYLNKLTTAPLFLFAPPYAQTNQVFLPMINFSAMMVSIEPLPPSNVPHDIDSVVDAAAWKIKEVLGPRCVHSSKAMDRAWLII